ncbi:MAG: FliI/YscN family ATPase [Polyangiales bacterium]
MPAPTTDSLEHSLQQVLSSGPLHQARGHLVRVSGTRLLATLPSVRLGELVHIGRRTPPLAAEVVAFEQEEVVLAPLGATHSLAPHDPVVATGRPLCIACSGALLGRVIDGLGAPLDGPPLSAAPWWPIERPAPAPLSRPRIRQRLVTGMRAIDTLLPLGQGQRIGLFAASGVGKSTLIGQIAQRADADVVVVGLIGERGRELVEFLEDALGPGGRARSVVVCATSDQPALVRLKSAHVAMAIAEWFRDQGARVLLLMDSVSRFARAGREVALAAGELPARRGYPPSVLAALPALVERAGTATQGSITALFTVLVEGNDMDEPVADEMRGLLDGHIVLDRKLAERGRYPAICPLQSVSRLMPHILPAEEQGRAAALRQLIAAYEHKRELIQLGAYSRGSDPLLDRALNRWPAIEAFLSQARGEHATLAESQGALQALLA